MFYVFNMVPECLFVHRTVIYVKGVKKRDEKILIRNKLFMYRALDAFFPFIYDFSYTSKVCLL